MTAIGWDLQTLAFREIQAFSTKPPKSEELFAGGSTATKRRVPLIQHGLLGHRNWEEIRPFRHRGF